jgi:hypothetical protein
MQLKQATISSPDLVERPDDPEYVAIMDSWCEYLSALIPSDENCREPLSSWLYPILDKVDYIDVTSNPKYPQDYEVKGFIGIEVYWKHLLRNILPPNSRGVVIVFEYQFTNEMFTYQIDGPEARYLGAGDKHDSKFENLKITHSLSLHDLDSYRLGVSKYYGLPLHSSHNSTYKVHIYPSDEMKSSKLPQLSLK